MGYHVSGQGVDMIRKFLLLIVCAAVFAGFFLLSGSYAGGSWEQVIMDYQNDKPLEWGQEVTGVITKFDPCDAKAIALTFDACGGGRGCGYDAELISFLRSEMIPATLFINARWIEANPSIFADLASDPLFEIANHGLKHKPLSVSGKKAYGIKGTNSAIDAAREIEGGAGAIEKASGKRPRFFRSGTNHYDEVAVRIASALGHSVIGCSVNGDGGATFSARQVKEQLLSAKPGDIILMHMNRPDGMTADGVAEALPTLRSRGFSFVLIP
jgi:peptidoglycan/xylan/chitin deacetylase (PgdA/CDA1 family)